jgi:putative aldouronate transport system permease protein
MKGGMRRNGLLHLMLLPGVLAVCVFSYLPMAGIIIAFQKFIPAKGIFGNQTWIGLGNFTYMLSMPTIFGVLRNTVVIAVGKMILGMIVPIVIALLLNEIASSGVKRSIQTIIYFPYFLSWVVFAGILVDILSPSTGIVNDFLALVGLPRLFFLGESNLFQGTMIATDIWKTFGFGTVVYLAAITSIDPTLYEAAMIDGCSRWQQTRYITLPGMSMIIVLLLVLNLGNILNAGFDQVFNLYSPTVYSTGDIIDTLVYRIGLLDYQFGPATAVGLFKSLVSFVLISSSYYMAYRFFDYRIF